MFSWWISETCFSYRQIKDPVLKPYAGESPVMGIHLGLRCDNGKVRLGDGVFVGVPEEEERLYSPPLLHRWNSCEHDVFPFQNNSVVNDEVDRADSCSKLLNTEVSNHASLIANLSNIEWR